MTSNALSATASLPYDNTSKLTKDQKKVAYIYGKHTIEDLEWANRIGKFPVRPSNLFLKIYCDVLRSTESHPDADMVAPHLIATSGVVPLTINAPFGTLLQHYRDCIVNAEKEVLLAAGFWRVGKATEIITNAFHELNRRIAERGGQKVVIKILWGRGTFHYGKKNTERQKQKLSLPTPAECPFLDFESMDMHKMVVGVFHVKYMIVDRKIMLLTSTNIQDRQNVEFVVHMEGKVVDSYYDVFHRQWNNKFVPPLPQENVPAPQRSGFDFTAQEVHAPCVFHSEHTEVPMFLANKLPNTGLGRHNWDVPQNVAWLSAMHHAQRSIIIETPDFNATLATNAVLDACKRGVQVTILLSWVYNALRERFFQGGTNVHVMKKMYKKLMKVGCHRNLSVYFYVARTQTNPTKVHPNHTKFMAVDDEVAVFGSGNMDTQSWHHSQEVNIAVNSPLLVKEWLDLFKISSNTHLYGRIDPNLPESPKQQIERMLARHHTQPTPVSTASATSIPFINNSQLPIVTPEADPAAKGNNSSYNNNFNTYYNTFRGIYNQSDNLQPASNSLPTSVTNPDFFSHHHSNPSSPSLSLPHPKSPSKESSRNLPSREPSASGYATS